MKNLFLLWLLIYVITGNIAFAEKAMSPVLLTPNNFAKSISKDYIKFTWQNAQNEVNAKVNGHRIIISENKQFNGYNPSIGRCNITYVTSVINSTTFTNGLRSSNKTGSGNDTLTGGFGNDTFIFSQGIKGNKNIDTVKDFVHGQDKIYLSADIFSKLATAVGFVSGNEPKSLAKVDSHYLVSAAKVKAVDASSYLLYDTKTGVLAYDEDGSGKLAASSFVTLTGKPVLTLDDFWIG